MKRNNNIFSAENANEGALHILFYLTLMISARTPSFFAIDNIDNTLNPRLCERLIANIATLAKERDKQVMITTHNPASLDGLDLTDDEQRLFVVKRSDQGHTKVERIKIKPSTDGKKYNLSQLFIEGYVGGLNDIDF
jgi:predicted ATPase